MSYDELRAALYDDEQFMRIDAIQQISLLGDMSLLLEGLIHEDSFVRQVASDGLLALGEDAVHHITPLLATTSGDLQRSIISLLSEIKSPEAVPALVDILHDQHHRTRLAAVNALGAIRDPSAVQHLIKLVKSSEASIRVAVLRALTELDPSTALNNNIEAINDIDPGVRKQAILNLARSEIKSPSVISTLIEALADPVGEVRTAAVNVLGEFGQPAIAALVDMLNTPYAHAAGRALFTIGSPAIRELTAALDDEDYGLAMAAAVVLSEMGATEILKARLESTNPTTRYAAKVALENMTS